MKSKPTLISIEEVAKLANVSTRTIYRIKV